MGIQLLAWKSQSVLLEVPADKKDKTEKSLSLGAYSLNSSSREATKRKVKGPAGTRKPMQFCVLRGVESKMGGKKIKGLKTLDAKGKF